MSFDGVALIVDALPPDGVKLIIPVPVPNFVPVKVIFENIPLSIAVVDVQDGVLAFVATQELEVVL